MKRLYISLLLMVGLFTFTACGGNNAPVTPVETPAAVVQQPEGNGNDAGNNEEQVPTPDPTPANGGDAENGNGNGNDNGDVNGNDDGNNDVDDAPVNGEDVNDAPANGGNDVNDEEITPEAPAVVVPARPADVVWSLATDEYFQHIASGTIGGSDDVLTTAYLVGAGTPTYRVIDNPAGGVALRLTHREQNWHGVDIISPELGLNTTANSYQLTIRGNLESAGNVLVGGGDSPYATLFAQDASAGDFTLTGTITAATIENAGSRGHLRIQANNLANLTIYEIEIRRVDLVVPEAPPERPANVIWSLATDPDIQALPVGNSGDGQAILATPYIQDAGSPMFEIVDNPHGPGNGIRVFNRQADWHTTDLHVGNMGLDLNANTYTITVRGRIIDPPEGSTADLMGTDSPWGRFAQVEVTGDGNFTVVANEVNAASMAENGSGDRIRLAASEEAGQSDFVIYEISVARN